MFNQKGFSIAQVAMAMAVMSVMSVGLTSMIQNQAKTIYYLEDQMSHQNLKKEIENLLSDSTVCTESLDNVSLPRGLIQANPNSGTSFVIKDSSGQTIYNPNNNNKNSFDNLKIKNIRVQNQDVTDPTLGGSAIINVDVERKRGGRNQALKSISIQKNVSIDNNFRVISCSGGSSDGWGECLENIGGATLGSFFGSGGLVNSPQARVPASTKVLKIVLPGRECRGGSANGPNGGNDWNSSISAAVIELPLDGKIVINGTRLTSGGIVSIENGARGYNGGLYYMGVKLADIGVCSQSSRPHVVHVPSSSLSYCAKSTDYRGPANNLNSYSFLGTTGGITATFWD